jgi:hypothetical protein
MPSDAGAGIDFVISSPGHHVAQILPLFEPLRQAGVRCRVLSLCEFRGFATPVETIRAAGADCARIVPRWIRPSPSVGAGGQQGSPGRRWSRELVWALLLGPRLAKAWRRPGGLVVVPNDVAFPYDRLLARLRRRGIPYVLLQEGIRFPLPSAANDAAYGTGGAVAIAAWGETSAEYFRLQGVPDERIFPTGNPRFDALPEPAPPRLRRPDGERKILLLVTNPIDDQGFCSTEQKMALFRRFVEGLEPLFEDGDIELWVRPHGRESAEAYARAVHDLHRHRITVPAAGSLHDLLAAADAVVVTASTVGLEALLFDRPLAVLELPGVGFVHDYVHSGAAAGLRWSESLPQQIGSLLGGGAPSREQVQRYLARSLATRYDAGGLVSRLLMSCLRKADAGSL